METEKKISLSRIKETAEINGLKESDVVKNYERLGYRVTSGGGDKLHWETVKMGKDLENGFNYQKENGIVKRIPLTKGNGILTAYYKGIKTGNEKSKTVKNVKIGKKTKNGKTKR